MNNIISIVGALTVTNTALVEFIKTQVYGKHTTLVALITSELVVFVAKYFSYITTDYFATFILGLVVWISSCSGFDKVSKVIESLGA